MEQGGVRQLLNSVFGWRAVMLYGEDQWPSYQAATKGLPLYKAFGRWRPLMAAPVRPDPFARPSRRERALKVHNSRKASAARAERKKLLQIARPLWEEALKMAPTGKRGRPSHKRCLQGLLAGQGVPVKRRQLDRLMADLKKTVTTQDRGRVDRDSTSK
jgi:hypothetical protein